MRDILQDWSEPAILYAIEANLFEFFTLSRYWGRAKVYSGPDLLWVLTDVPFPMFNSIGRAQLTIDSVDLAIEAVMAQGRTQKVPLAWTIGPNTRPSDLGKYLKAHGFSFSNDVLGMAADLFYLKDGLPKPADLIIAEAKNIETLKVWCQTTVTGFGMPNFVENALLELFVSIGFAPNAPLRHYLGYIDGNPVATTSLALGAGVAGLYNVTTLPKSRGQGIATAMARMALDEAHRLGYRVGVLHSTEEGEGIYRRLGFKIYCRMNHYIWHPPQP
jgi:ribosomal protein S18 acetylase RimI-like enzyme